MAVGINSACGSQNKAETFDINFMSFIIFFIAGKTFSQFFESFNISCCTRNEHQFLKTFLPSLNPRQE